jgi:metallo-beta-lactamase family protein
VTLTLTFHGAAGGVTGSCFLLTTPRAKVLVDCGLFQGSKTLKALNYKPFPFAPGALDAVLLTHAHIDHSGQLPKLVKAGYRRRIYATEQTRALCEIMLADCGHIQESEVEHLNRRNQQRGRPLVEPIYTTRDAARAMKQFTGVAYHQWLDVAPGVRARWWDAGHILGSASIELEVDAGESAPRRLCFSGDIGAPGREFLADPEGPRTGLDYLVMESTYGGVERSEVQPEARRAALANELVKAHAAGGPLVIPAFAIERTQELLADLFAVVHAGAAPAGPIFLDSPLAIKACQIFLEEGWVGEHNPFAAVREAGWVHFLEKPRESDRLDKVSGWHIIMAGSGMCDAGRIRKHLQRLLWRREATVLLTGFQAQGSLGRLLAEGRKTVSIRGETIAVRAHIRSLDIYSGHADGPALASWARQRGAVAGRVFLVHGEPENLAALKERLAGVFDPERMIIPDLDESFAFTEDALSPGEHVSRLEAGAETAHDWHNARVELLQALDERLEAAGDDAAKAALLARLQASLGAGV